MIELKQIDGLYYYKSKTGEWKYVQTEVAQEIKELRECLDWLYNQDDGNNPEMEKRIEQALNKEK